MFLWNMVGAGADARLRTSCCRGPKPRLAEKPEPSSDIGLGATILRRAA
jgi:hypothetical protein